VSARHDLIRASYAAFNARDLDAALAGVHPEVDWPNAVDGGRLHGRAQVREYWSRQFERRPPRRAPGILRR
jgi:SnoaL-like domain